MSELGTKVLSVQVPNAIDFEQVTLWLDEYRSIDSQRNKDHLQNLIAMTCMPLVRRIAHTLARRSTDPVEDIIQVGSVGLIKAIKSYNPEISKNFKSYSTYLVTGEIRHYLRDKAGMIKAPRAIQELCYRVNKIAYEMIEEFGEKPTNEQSVRRQKFYEKLGCKNTGIKYFFPNKYKELEMDLLYLGISTDAPPDKEYINKAISKVHKSLHNSIWEY